MPLLSNNDGSATFYNWDDPVFKRRMGGESYWGTLLGAIQGGGVIASAFSHPMRVEALYDASEALTAHPGPLPSPVGVRANYRIVHTSGKTNYAGVWPADIERMTT
jgi:hypothetical protein